MSFTKPHFLPGGIDRTKNLFADSGRQGTAELCGAGLPQKPFHPSAHCMVRFFHGAAGIGESQRISPVGYAQRTRLTLMGTAGGAGGGSDGTSGRGASTFTR
ncbi:MAG: hypothetical protein ABSE16_21385 [Verrucomicrobiota bacterium]